MRILWTKNPGVFIRCCPGQGLGYRENSSLLVYPVHDLSTFIELGDVYRGSLGRKRVTGSVTRRANEWGIVIFSRLKMVSCRVASFVGSKLTQSLDFSFPAHFYPCVYSALMSIHLWMWSSKEYISLHTALSATLLPDHAPCFISAGSGSGVPTSRIFGRWEKGCSPPSSPTTPRTWPRLIGWGRHCCSRGAHTSRTAEGRPRFDNDLESNTDGSSGVLILETNEGEVFHVFFHVYDSIEKDENLKRPRNGQILGGENLPGAALRHRLQVATANEKGYRQVLLQEAQQKTLKHLHVARRVGLRGNGDLTNLPY